MSSIKIFIRSDKETVENAIRHSQPEFIKIYEGYSTPQILKEAYLSIREEVCRTNSTPSPFNFTDLSEPDYKILKPSEPFPVGTETKVDLVKTKEVIKKETPPEKKPTVIKSKINKKQFFVGKFDLGSTQEESIEEFKREYPEEKIDKYYVRDLWKAWELTKNKK